MVSRSAGGLRLHSREPEFGKIQLIHKDVDHPDGVILRDVILEPFRKQCGLRPILTLDVSLHDRAARAMLVTKFYSIVSQIGAFSHSLGQLRPLVANADFRRGHSSKCDSSPA